MNEHIHINTCTFLPTPAMFKSACLCDDDERYSYIRDSFIYRQDKGVSHDFHSNGLHVKESRTHIEVTSKYRPSTQYIYICFGNTDLL